MIAFLVALGVGLAIGWVCGAVWQAVQEQRHSAELLDYLRHHGSGPPDDDEEGR